MAANEKALRESIIAHGARLVAAGLGGAPDCGVSARLDDSLLITPHGSSYAALRPAMIARMPLVGEYGAWKGPLKPSAEWRIHLEIARARPDIGAIMRFQSPYATALAMARRDIPAAHSMIALFGGSVVRCARYAPAGTTELAGLALEALGQSHAALLSNYCALVTGATLEDALVRAARARDARQTLRHRAFGRPSGDSLRRGSRPHRRAPEVQQLRRRGADSPAGQGASEGEGQGQGPSKEEARRAQARVEVAASPRPTRPAGAPPPSWPTLSWVVPPPMPPAVMAGLVQDKPGHDVLGFVRGFPTSEFLGPKANATRAKLLFLFFHMCAILTHGLK